MKVWSRIKHRGVRAIHVVKGEGIGGGDMIIVEEESSNELLGFNRYRILAKVVKLVVEAEENVRWWREGWRIAFDPIEGSYPNIILEFCPSCEETEVIVRVLKGQERPAESS